MEELDRLRKTNYGGQTRPSARRRAGRKPAPVRETAPPHSAREIIEGHWAGDLDPWEFKQDAVDLFGRVGILKAEARDEALWDEGRSARVMEELAESTGEAIARISARGDQIDRIQKETRELSNDLVASEADA